VSYPSGGNTYTFSFDDSNGNLQAGSSPGNYCIADV